MKKQISFKEELRRSLINHALLPFVLLTFAVVLTITAIGFSIIRKKNIDSAETYSKEFVQLIESYSKEADKISERLSVKLFLYQSEHRVNELTEIYGFLNKQEIRGEFYLFDAEFNQIFGTRDDNVLEEYLENHLRMNKNDEDFWQSAGFMYDDWNLRRTTSPSCVIFRKIENEQGVTGYGGFVINADYFPTNPNSGNQFVIITNRFHRAFSKGGDKFCNDRGKILGPFREEGLSVADYQWCYVTRESALDGMVYIYAISECTTFLQIVLIASAMVFFLSCIMSYVIYRSAGKVAKKKTDIMYKLIGAFEEVKEGNLDVTVDICSGDEFEMMGNTFNMMSGSIRDLLIRQQELTKENTTSMIQALESQFNPHFLFNTLESIRYMIRQNVDMSEKMVVNLSKLLRYSIQTSDKMVILAEELGFADKYLQIMLCRYGDRLQYEIDIDESLHEIEIPKMVMQPILENSIKYGYGENHKTLKISITSEVVENGIEILINDDGKGIEPELLKKLQESLEVRHNYSGHIGIHNVHRRLHLIYGENYGLTVESQEGRGTTVRLFVPEFWEENNVTESIDC